MVVFTCNHCGDSLQKPKVEKHYLTKCRRDKSLTCVDCFKDFFGEEYDVHKKCVTEAERYSAKGSIPAGVVKKGENKQMQWTEMIESIVATETNIPHSQKTIFEILSGNDNVPRKKKPFTNFIQSSTGFKANPTDIDNVWNIIEKYKAQSFKQHAEEKAKAATDNKEKKDKDAKENGDASVEETEMEVKTPAKKKNKRKSQVIGDDNAQKDEGNDKVEAKEEPENKKKKRKNQVIKPENESVVEEGQEEPAKKKKKEEKLAKKKNAEPAKEKKKDGEAEVKSPKKKQTKSGPKEVQKANAENAKIIEKVLSNEKDLTEAQLKIFKQLDKSNGETIPSQKKPFYKCVRAIIGEGLLQPQISELWQIVKKYKVAEVPAPASPKIKKEGKKTLKENGVAKTNGKITNGNVSKDKDSKKEAKKSKKLNVLN